MKHLHMLLAILTIAIFLYQFMQVMTGKDGRLPNKGLKIAAHVLYTLLIVAGIVTLMPAIPHIGVPHWVIAKVVLFVVAISSTIKATRANTLPNQAKMGMIIALIAYIGIVILAFLKPMNLF